MPELEEKPVADMSLTELTAEYNRQVEALEANDTSLKPVKFKRIKLFKDRTTGIRRIDELTNPPAPKERAPRVAKPKTNGKAKTKAKPKAKIKAKGKAKVTKVKKEKTGSLSEEFGFKGGGEREQLLLILAGKMGRQVPRAEISDELAKFIGKIKLRIERKKLRYKVIKERDDGAVSYGLYPK